MTLTLYQIPASSPCRAIHMTAKHLGLNFKIRDVDFANGEHKTPEFLKINPLGQIPAIDDHGFLLSESRAIMTYLVNQYAPDHSLYPKEPKQRANIDRMLSFDLGTIYKSYSEYAYPQMFEGKPMDPEKEKPFREGLKKLELILSGSKYVAGNTLSLADLSIFSELIQAPVVNFSFSGFPHITMWIKKLSTDLPYNDEINVKPLADFKKYFDSMKK